MSPSLLESPVSPSPHLTVRDAVAHGGSGVCRRRWHVRLLCVSSPLALLWLCVRHAAAAVQHAQWLLHAPHEVVWFAMMGALPPMEAHRQGTPSTASAVWHLISLLSQSPKLVLLQLAVWVALVVLVACVATCGHHLQTVRPQTRVEPCFVQRCLLQLQVCGGVCAWDGH